MKVKFVVALVLTTLSTIPVLCQNGWQIPKPLDLTYGVREDLSSSPYRAARLWIKNYSREFVQIQSGDILLSGALYFPKLEEDKKIPAIVLAHGSGPTTQYNMGYYIYLGLKMDSAVLVCDKRGVGNSEGVFDPNYLKSEQHFTELASDLVAQLKWIKSQPEIDLTKIGMMGPSQAGWIMPIAAKMDNSVRFIVSLSGPTVSVGVENYFSSLTREYMSPPGISIEEADKELSNFSGDPLYDPVPILEELQTNILWQFGTHDRSVPVSECIRVLEKLNKTNFDIKVVQHVGHGSTNIHTGEYEDFVQIIKPWLIKIGVVEPWD